MSAVQASALIPGDAVRVMASGPARGQRGRITHFTEDGKVAVDCRGNLVTLSFSQIEAEQGSI